MCGQAVVCGEAVCRGAQRCGPCAKLWVWGVYDDSNSSCRGRGLLCCQSAAAAAEAEQCCAVHWGEGGGRLGHQTQSVGWCCGRCLCLSWCVLGRGAGGGGSCQPVPGSSGPTILQCTCVTRGVWWDNLTCAWIGPDPFFWQLGRTRHFVCANAFVCVNAACRIANGCLGLVAGPLVQPSQYSSPSVSTFFHSVGIYTLCVVAASSHCCSATLVAPSLSSLLCVSAVCVE